MIERREMSKAWSLKESGFLHTIQDMEAEREEGRRRVISITEELEKRKGEEGRKDREDNERRIWEEVKQARGMVEVIGRDKRQVEGRLRVAMERIAGMEIMLREKEIERDREDEGWGRGGGGAGGGMGMKRRKGGRVVGLTEGMDWEDMKLKTPGKAKVLKYVENVDKWSVGIGSEMRANPMLRTGFVFYLLFLHVWAAGIVAWHAHGFEKEHGDFGSYRHMEQVKVIPKG